MDEKIEFLSSAKGFTAVKKLKLDNTKTPTDIVQFLASIQITTNSKIKSLLEEIADTDKLNELIKEFLSLDISSFFNRLYSAKTKKLIKALLPSDFDKKLTPTFIEAYQVYIMEKYFLANNKAIGYHQILFPALKKLKKAIKG